MIAGQLELPLFDAPEGAVHSALLRWSPEGKPDGTYTLTCDCDGIPMISHTWDGQEAMFSDHCKKKRGE